MTFKSRSSSDLDAIRQQARSEIARPTLDLTKQFLQVLPLQMSEGEPVIAGVNETENEITVYFSILGEEFFLAICLENQPEFAPYTAYIEPGSRVYLRIDNSRGDVEIPLFFPEVEVGKSGFYFDPLKQEVDAVENKIERLLKLLEVHGEVVKQLAAQTKVCLNIAYYGYQSQMWGFHFNKRTISLLSDLNIEIDIDLYAGGQEIEPLDFGQPNDEKAR